MDNCLVYNFYISLLGIVGSWNRVFVQYVYYL